VGGTNIFDPANYNLGGGNFNFFKAVSLDTQNHILERDLTGSISLTRQYAVGSHFGAWEMGFKVRNAHKTSNFREPIFDTNPRFTSLAPLTSFVGGTTNPKDITSEITSCCRSPTSTRFFLTSTPTVVSSLKPRTSNI
jgi:hypothetical protein